MSIKEAVGPTDEADEEEVEFELGKWISIFPNSSPNSSEVGPSAHISLGFAPIKENKEASE